MLYSGIIAKIDLLAIEDNFNSAQAIAKQSHSDIIPVIKADAYGYGAIAVAKQLHQKAQRFALARYQEAMQLREAGISTPLLILSDTLTASSLQLASTQALEPVIYSPACLDALLSKTNAKNIHAPVNIWVKIDTGMHRLGLSIQDFEQAHAQLEACPHIQQIYLMTHFASADAADDTFLVQQLECFHALTQRFPQYPSSTANSAALLRESKYHSDFARPGIMLFGANPLFHLNHATQLACCMELTAPIIAIREISAGESVGYNRRWIADKPARIATVAIGYADGYPRHAKNKTPVFINNQVAHLVGTVSMDMITVDVTHIENLQVGDRVELWGKNIDVNQVAHHSDTISYALFTGVSGRTQKIYASI